MTNAHPPGRRRTPRRLKSKAARRPAAVRRGPAAPRRPRRRTRRPLADPVAAPGPAALHSHFEPRRFEPRRAVPVSARPARLGEHLRQHRHARGLPGGHRPSPPPHVRPRSLPPTTPGPPPTHGRTPPARPRQLRGGHRRRNDHWGWAGCRADRGRQGLRQLCGSEQGRLPDARRQVGQGRLVGWREWGRTVREDVGLRV